MFVAVSAGEERHQPWAGFRIRAAARIELESDVRSAVAQRTARRYVALFAVGFEVVLIDDGCSRCSIEVPDLALQLDTAVAHAATRAKFLRHWVVLDQTSGEAFVIPARDAHRLLGAQAAA